MMHRFCKEKILVYVWKHQNGLNVRACWGSYWIFFLRCPTSFFRLEGIHGSNAHLVITFAWVKFEKFLSSIIARNDSGDKGTGWRFISLILLRDGVYEDLLSCSIYWSHEWRIPGLNDSHVLHLHQLLSK